MVKDGRGRNVTKKKNGTPGEVPWKQKRKSWEVEECGQKMKWNKKETQVARRDVGERPVLSR